MSDPEYRKHMRVGVLAALDAIRRHRGTVNLGRNAAKRAARARINKGPAKTPKGTHQ